jgi:L-fuculose-phosphate aldolase
MSLALRRSIVETARRALSAGLTCGTSGNFSARGGSGVLITPSGIEWETMSPSDIVELDLSGAVTGPRTKRLPSSEWRIHLDLYRTRPEVGAVAHLHPPWATTIACLRKDLPAVHYMIAVAGGATVRCAAYATFGSAELSAAVLAALEDRTACLLANHGLVAVGTDLAAAMWVAGEVEGVAELYWRSLCAGTPVILDEAEMARVRDRFKDYPAGGLRQQNR